MEKFFQEYLQEEAIGVKFTPRCGGCYCCNCPIEAKQISLKTEMEYKWFKSLSYHDRAGSQEDLGLYWVTCQPRMVDKGSLVNNRIVVLGVSNSTVRKLEKRPVSDRFMRIS